MEDVVVYCPCPAAMVAWLKDNAPQHLVNDGTRLRLRATKTQTCRAAPDGPTVAIVRCLDGDPGEMETKAVLLQLQAASLVELLGTWDEAEADPAAAVKIASARPPAAATLPAASGDEVPVAYQPPARIGSFA